MFRLLKTFSGCSFVLEQLVEQLCKVDRLDPTRTLCFSSAAVWNPIESVVARGVGAIYGGTKTNHHGCLGYGEIHTDFSQLNSGLFFGWGMAHSLRYPVGWLRTTF